MAATEFFFSENGGLGSRGGVMGCWRTKVEEGGGGLIKVGGGVITFGLENTGSVVVVVEFKNSFSG